MRIRENGSSRQCHLGRLKCKTYTHLNVKLELLNPWSRAAVELPSWLLKKVSEYEGDEGFWVCEETTGDEGFVSLYAEDEFWDLGAKGGY